MSSMNLLPAHQAVYEQLRAERMARQGREVPAATATAAGDNADEVPPPPTPVHPRDDGAFELLARMAQAADLMELLRYDNLTGHGDEIKLYYLIGWAYDQGARSGRQILKLLAAPPSGPVAAEDLAGRVRRNLKLTRRTLFGAIAKLEELLHTTLVTRLGEGLSFAGLTKAGEFFWRLVADYLRKTL